MSSEPIIKENNVDVKNYCSSPADQQQDEQTSVPRHFDIFTFDANDQMWYLPYVDIEVLENDEYELHLNHAAFVRYWQKNVPSIFTKNKCHSDIHKYVYLNGVYKQSDNWDMKGYIQRMLPDQLVRSSNVNELYSLIQNVPQYTDEDKLNPEDYINFKNGLYNIRTGQIEPHTPDVLCTIQLPLSYDPNDDYHQFIGGTFDTFMNHFLGGDKTQIQLALEFIGVAISNTPAWKYKKALLLLGPGNVGKSVYRWIKEKLVGKENYYNCDLKKLENGRFELANLHGKRLGGTADMEFMEVKDLKLFKRLTGGDEDSAEHKGRPGFNYKFNGLLSFGTNEFPRFEGDKGDHVYNRFTIIRAVGLTYEKGATPIPGAVEQDRNLRAKLEKEFPYIVHLALEALKIVIANDKYSETELQKREIEKFKNANNNIAAFFDECICERFDGTLSDKCTKAMLYKVFVKWASERHEKFKGSRSEFYAHLEANGAEKCVSNGYDFYKNFTLTPEAKEKYKTIYGEDSPAYKTKYQAYLQGRIA